MAILTGNNLSLGYEGREIISGVNFKIEKGDYLCIVGENGAGKSTLMKTILGLIPPVSGNIILGDSLKANEIGYLPQQAFVQRDFPASVSEIVLSGCQGRKGTRPFYSKAEKQLARSCMQKMNIDHLANRCYRELSGGQQQRVLLARALCATGKILLLDEPVAGLDPKAMSELYNLTKELNEEDVTVIMITHDVTVAIRYASHVLHIDKTTFFGTVKEYLESNVGKKFLITHEMENDK